MKNPWTLTAISAFIIVLGFDTPAAASIDFTNFHTPGQVDTELANLVAEHSAIAQLLTLGMSVEGRPLNGIKISSNPALDDPNKSDVVFIALHHAREWIAAEMALYLAEYLLTHYDTDPELQACMNGVQIWIIPVGNPDGYVFSASAPANRMWRKNRRNNGDGTFGVDLNRNFSYQWGLDSGSSPYTNDGTYRGPFAFSEPESAALRDFVQARHNPRVVLSYHSCAEAWLRPWRYTTEPAPGEQSLAFITQNSIARIAAVHGLTYSESIGYTSSGATADYFWGQMRVASFTSELRSSDGCFAPAPSEIIPNNEENLPAALALIKDAGCRTLWIKDYPGDTGAEPSAVWLGDHWSHAFWVSPDIWTVPETLVAGSTVSLNVRVHNDSSGTLNGSIVRAYYTDPRVALEFPTDASVLIGEQTVNIAPGDTTLSFSWTVPTGTNMWGEHHWCVGAIATHPDDRPLTTQIERTSNIGCRNFETIEIKGAKIVFVAVTNFLHVPAEYAITVDPKSLPTQWQTTIPRIPTKRTINRKARLLRAKNPVLEPGETAVQPIRVSVPEHAKPGTVAEINVNGMLLPLIPGKRIPVGNGYTFRVQVAR
jgi:carboxypeptidase T